MCICLKKNLVCLVTQIRLSIIKYQWLATYLILHESLRQAPTPVYSDANQMRSSCYINEINAYFHYRPSRPIKMTFGKNVLFLLLITLLQKIVIFLPLMFKTQCAEL